MKILGYIFLFIINPFKVLLNIDIKGREITRRRWINIALAVIISIIISALIVFLAHKFMKTYNIG